MAFSLDMSELTLVKRANREETRSVGAGAKTHYRPTCAGGAARAPAAPRSINSAARGRNGPDARLSAARMAACSSSVAVVVAYQVQRAVNHVQQQFVGRPASRICSAVRMAVSALAIISPSSRSALALQQKAEHVGRIIVLEKLDGSAGGSSDRRRSPG